MAYPIIRRTLVPWLLRNVSQVEGLQYLPARGPFLLVANHVSYVEPAILSMLVVRTTKQRVWALTKFAVWRIFKFVGLASWLGMIPVEPARRDRCLAIAEEKLRGGYPLLIFPEGSRQYTEELGRAKTGAARLALATGVPVIPVGYIGPKTRSSKLALTVFLRMRRDLVIRFGPAMRFPRQDPASVTKERLVEVTNAMMHEISRLSGRPYPY